MKKINLKKIALIFCSAVLLMGCTSTQGNRMGSLNRAYNQKNQTENRSLIFDTVVATALYNNPEIVPYIGKSKTRSKTNTNINSVSNTVTDSQYFSSGNSRFGQSRSITTTKTQAKSKTKSTTTGIGASTNILDYYLR